MCCVVCDHSHERAVCTSMWMYCGFLSMWFFLVCSCNNCPHPLRYTQLWGSVELCSSFNKYKYCSLHILNLFSITKCKHLNHIGYAYRCKYISTYIHIYVHTYADYAHMHTYRCTYLRVWFNVTWWICILESYIFKFYYKILLCMYFCTWPYT